MMPTILAQAAMKDVPLEVQLQQPALYIALLFTLVLTSLFLAFMWKLNRDHAEDRKENRQTVKEISETASEVHRECFTKADALGRECATVIRDNTKEWSLARMTLETMPCRETCGNFKPKEST